MTSIIILYIYMIILQMAFLAYTKEAAFTAAPLYTVLIIINVIQPVLTGR